MSELSKSLGTMEFDGLIADINPKLAVSGGTIRKLSKADTIKRGTVLAKSGGTAGDNKLVVLGTAAASNEVLTAYCILCDDVAVGTTDCPGVPDGLLQLQQGYRGRQLHHDRGRQGCPAQRWHRLQGCCTCTVRRIQQCLLN